jgi:hypothetical protein
MTETTNITVHVHNYPGAPEAVVIDDLTGLAEAIKNRVLVADPEPVPRIVPAFTNRMDNDDRRALFAAWADAFGRDTTSEDRHAFTRAALGLPRDANPSWSRAGNLTADQSYHLVRLLNAIAEIA